jgi:branched-chain amino acid transport system permease protein
MRTIQISSVLSLFNKQQHKIIALALGVLFIMPLTGNHYLVIVFTTIGFYSLVTLGLILLMGFAGQISLGQAIFFGLGAYTSGILTTRYSLSPWVVIIAAAITTGCIAVIIGRAMFRLRGLIVGGITIALNLVFYYLIVSVADLTGGATGMMNIPQLPSGGFISYSFFIYYLVWAITLLALIFSLNLVNSRTGRALRAMNLFDGGSDQTAQVLGINIMKYKVAIFAVSAMYASVAGSIYAHYVSCIEPSTFGVDFSVMIAIMAILGGLSSPWGAILGAGLLVGIIELLREFVPLLIGGSTGAYELIAYGVILIATLRFLPRGLISVCRKLVSGGGNGRWKAILPHSRVS